MKVKENADRYLEGSLMKLVPLTNLHNENLPSQLGLLNTPNASLQRDKTPSTCVLDMTLNNLIVRFQ